MGQRDSNLKKDEFGSTPYLDWDSDLIGGVCSSLGDGEVVCTSRPKSTDRHWAAGTDPLGADEPRRVGGSQSEPGHHSENEA